MKRFMVMAGVMAAALVWLTASSPVSAADGVAAACKCRPCKCVDCKCAEAPGKCACDPCKCTDCKCAATPAAATGTCPMGANPANKACCGSTGRTACCNGNCAECCKGKCGDCCTGNACNNCGKRSTPARTNTIK